MLVSERFLNIPLTFGIDNVNNNIEYIYQSNIKGYVCVIDFNVLANTFKYDDYHAIINNSIFNTCDGSLIAFLLNIKYKKKYSSYNGPEIFKKFITNNNYKQLLIGPSHQDYQLLIELNDNASHIHNLELPFKKVNEFDYKDISKSINEIQPDLIWVMLGAPKQEKFIHNLMPYVKKGLYFGTGTALNFYFERLNNRTFQIYGLRFIWLERLILEPRKQIKRIFNFLTVFHKILKTL